MEHCGVVNRDYWEQFLAIFFGTMCQFGFPVFVRPQNRHRSVKSTELGTNALLTFNFHFSETELDMISIEN